MERKPKFDWHPSPRRPRCPSSVSSSSASSSRLPSFSSDAGDSFVSAEDCFDEDEPESSVCSKEAIAGGFALQFVVPKTRFAWLRRKPRLPNVPEEYRLETHSGVLRRFSLRELQVATDNFSRKNKLGRGYLGIVYKGQLADGSLVVVKRLKDPHIGMEPQFEEELVSLKHNLLILQGVCMTPTEQLLVYPYMTNTSLAHQLRAEEDPKVHLGQLKMFSLRELQVATDSFSDKNILGTGGLGNVYKGRLADGSLVAVKRHKERTQFGELRFLTEIEMTNNAVHRNLLRPRGFCMTPTELLLVYPYMANRSVESRLRERLPTEPPLDWPTRRQIALGSARGLSYLHDHCDPKIIHRNVKPASILLDEEFEAALGDFGLAILIDCKDTHVTPDSLSGTFGYMAPEYLSTRKCSEKTDVFGYGIMLLELITGQRAFDLARPANDDDVMILDWVKGLLEEERLDTLVDPELHGNYMEAEVKFAVQLAILCSQVSPMGRPKMSEVVRILEGEDLTERWEKWKNRERWEKWKNRERWEKWKKENKRWEEWEDWEEWKNTETWEEWKNTERWEEWKKEKERWEEWKNTERWEEWEEWRVEWKNTERWEEWMNTEIWEEWKKEKERWEEWKNTERWEEWEEWKNTEIWEEWKKENERWEKWKNSERWEEWKKENERWEEWKKENERWEEWRGEWKKENGRWEERKENECRLDPELGTYPRWIEF